MTGALLFLGFVLTACFEAPTGDDDNPELSFSPTVLDFGTDKQSLNLRIENVGTGILDWELSIPTAPSANFVKLFTV